MAKKIVCVVCLWLYAFTAWAESQEPEIGISLFKSSLVLVAILALFIYLKFKVLGRPSLARASGVLKLKDSLQLSATHRLLVLEIEGRQKLIGMSQSGFFLLEDKNDR